MFKKIGKDNGEAGSIDLKVVYRQKYRSLDRLNKLLSRLIPG